MTEGERSTESESSYLDGSSLRIEELVRVARDPRIRVEVEPAAWGRVAKAQKLVETIAADYREAKRRQDQRRVGEAPVLDYGVTTGFGEFKNIAIDADALRDLQRNILLSHSAGIGESADFFNPASYFSAEVVRAALVIRLNAFLKGHSGVRRELVELLREVINQGIVPLVPTRGSVGSSGDLCPLSHLGAVLLGEGHYYEVSEPRDLRSGQLGALLPAKGLAKRLGRKPFRPSFKEGLALTNGATFSTALLALAVHDAELLAQTCDIAASLSLEAVCGCARAFDAKVHDARGMDGQIASAAHIRQLIETSRLVDSAGAVQDVYSLRCAPAVHGAARDAIAYARKAAQAEINAATDNPLFFPDETIEERFDHGFKGNWGRYTEDYDGDLKRSYSAGNFHGEPIGMAADFLAIGLAELANISERRVQMLLDAHHNRNLPGNLVPHRGINSGLMIAQYSAAGIVSENKVLCHPASVDSIPTSANSEDHNAMATIAARKVITVLRNAQAVLAIELLTAAQAVDWRVAMNLDPVHKELGSAGRAALKSAEREARHFTERTASERHRANVARQLGRGTKVAYLQVRARVDPLTADRMLDRDIASVRAVIEDGSLPQAVENVLHGPARR